MKKIFKITLSLVAVGLLAVLFYPVASSSLDARISDFLVTRNAKDVLIYFTVKDCYSPKTEEAILAGIPTSFTFLIKVVEEGTLWDSTISAHEIRHTLKYDNVRNTFYVTYSEQGDVPPVEFRDLESAKRAMVDLSGIPVAPLSALKKDGRYLIKAKAKLAKARMPLRLEYVLFFASMWDFETDWYKQEFVNK